MNKLNLIIIVIIVAVIGFFAWQRFSPNEFGLPRGGNSIKEIIVVKDGEVMNDAEANDENAKITALIAEEKSKQEEVLPSTDKDVEARTEEVKIEVSKTVTKEIFITDGVKHSVPLDEIMGGGPKKDGIPSIDSPKFESIGQAGNVLDDTEIGLAFELDGVNRFYPFNILVRHEIVNDQINNKRFLVTYCPLCFSGIVFDPKVNGELVEFGTSGMLWQSNLVMYDRKTDSLWSQILGEAIAGELTGSQLKVLTSDQMRFGEWKELFPSGEVLSRETGIYPGSSYDSDPYGSYYTDSVIFRPVRAYDDRLHNKAFVLGIIIDGKAKAYLPEAVEKVGEVEEVFVGKTIVVRYEKDIDAVRIYEKKSNGELERINPIPSFWFSWVAAHPETELYN
jgi:hypothetical protein